MKLSKDQVRQVAKLARLKLKEAEIEKFSLQLSAILEYMDLLNEVDTEKVEPTAQVTGLKNVMRKDADKKWGKSEELLACSPLPIEKNQIKVKPVFE